jgi:lipoprotein NlpD
MGKRFLRLRSIIILFMAVIQLSFSGCMNDNVLAPVVNAWHQPSAGGSSYTVRKGDTLYSIAWQFGLDYRALAQANNLSAPYIITPGQTLNMIAKAMPLATVELQLPTQLTAQEPVSPIAKKRPQTKIGSRRLVRDEPQVIKPQRASSKRPIPKRVSRWAWPAKGRIIKKFNKRSLNAQGIDISGLYGEKIRAAAPGKVVYSGSGVRGYGNLIIIKHTDSYLSAYAFNKKNLVADGVWVRQGQPIALMGRNMGGRTMLHFEIRKNGRPVNPLHFLR